MPYRVQWAVPKRVILTTFWGVISEADLLAFVTEIRTAIAEGQAPIFHISNSLGMQNVSISIGALSTLIRSLPSFGKLGAQIDVNRPRTMNSFLAGIGGQLIRVETLTVATLDEAVEIIKRKDLGLNDVAWDLSSPEDTTTPATNPADTLIFPPGRGDKPAVPADRPADPPEAKA